MQEIVLNGDKMLDKASTHAYLKRKLALPTHYGENLDALWDCLSTDLSLKRIIIYKPDAMIANLGTYGESIIELFVEVSEENEFILFEIEHETMKE
jgi:ribonuclease inhibitor